MNRILKQLAADYPLLYLNPDRDTQETYRLVVLRGEDPEMKTLSHYRGDEHDSDETVGTPVGSIRVVTLGNRRDFELVLRGFTAVKDGPLTPVPASQGAAMLTAFNWPCIHAHLAQFPEEVQDAEFKRFTAVKENFIDYLVLLSRGPYSGVPASKAGLPEEKWLAVSDVIRRYHELTHAICRRRYPDDVDSIRDELIADAVGLLAAYGYFSPEMELLFLGIQNGRYKGGRLENYTDEPENLVAPITVMIERIQKIIEDHSGTEPFDLIPVLMESSL